MIFPLVNPVVLPFDNITVTAVQVQSVIVLRSQMIFPLVNPVVLPFDNITVTAVQVQSVIVNSDTGVVQIFATPLEAQGPRHTRQAQFTLSPAQLTAFQTAIKAAITAVPGVPALQ